MSSFPKVALLMATLALTACANTGGIGGFGGAGRGAGTPEVGSVDDPKSVAYFQQTVGDRVLFSVDQSTLDETSRLVLLAQANWLMENAEYMAVIQGHADEQGTREYNLALGARRANAVIEFLLSQGVASNRLRTVSFGKERPIEICSAESCYAQNRRAVTVLAGGLTS